MAKLSDPVGYLKEHYNYELWMLRELHDKIVDPLIFHEFDIVMRNACIEALCIHARALMAFYATKQRDTDVIADLFCPDFSMAIDDEAKAFMVNVNKQIAHLTQEREAAIKVNGIDFARIRTTIEIQHRRFHESLPLALSGLIYPPDDRFTA